MAHDLTESDWKAFKAIQANVTDRMCLKVLAEVESAVRDESLAPWERFAEAERLLAKGRKDVEPIDEVRRSLALLQLRRMRSMNLVSDADLAPLSEATRAKLEVR